MRLKRLLPTLPTDLQPLIPILDAAGLKSTDQIVHTPSSTVFRLLPRTLDAEFTKKKYESLLERCLEVELGGSGPVLASELDSLSSTMTLAPRFGLESLDDLLVDFVGSDSDKEGANRATGDDRGFKGGILEVAGTKSSGRTVSPASSSEFRKALHSVHHDLYSISYIILILDCSAILRLMSILTTINMTFLTSIPNPSQLLTLHLILTTLIQDLNSTCIWIDTEASFDPDRTRSILDSIFRKNQNQVVGSAVEASKVKQAETAQDERDRQAEEVLRRLEVVNAFELDGTKSSLEAALLVDDEPVEPHSDGGMQDELEGAGARQSPARQVAKRFVVIDSIGSILSPCLSTGDSHGTRGFRLDHSLVRQLIR